jgi:hypothetical protein
VTHRKARIWVEGPAFWMFLAVLCFKKLPLYDEISIRWKLSFSATLTQIFNLSWLFEFLCVFLEWEFSKS